MKSMYVITVKIRYFYINLPILYIIYNVNLTIKQTYIGPMIVSMNPFKPIKGLYGVEKINAYRNKRRETSGLPPHIFAISEKSFTNIVENNESQSILISGESGMFKRQLRVTYSGNR